MSALGRPLITAVVGRLEALLAMPVYEAVPQGSDLPYVTLDEIEVQPRDGVSNTRDAWFVYLTVWSGKKGRGEALDAISSIYQGFHRQELPMSEGRATQCLVRRRSTNRDVDGATVIGNVTLEIWTET